MSIYANDPRVVQVDDGRYDVPSPHGWTVQYDAEADEWRAFAENEQFTNRQYWACDTAEEAIALIIGAPVE